MNGTRKENKILLGMDAVIISIDDAETLVEMAEELRRHDYEFYAQLRDKGFLNIFIQLRSCVKTYEERLFP